MDLATTADWPRNHSGARGWRHVRDSNTAHTAETTDTKAAAHTINQTYASAGASDKQGTNSLKEESGFLQTTLLHAAADAAAVARGSRQWPAFRHRFQPSGIPSGPRWRRSNIVPTDKRALALTFQQGALHCRDRAPAQQQRRNSWFAAARARSGTAASRRACTSCSIRC